MPLDREDQPTQHADRDDGLLHRQPGRQTQVDHDEKGAKRTPGRQTLAGKGPPKAGGASAAVQVQVERDPADHAVVKHSHGEMHAALATLTHAGHDAKAQASKHIAPALATARGSVGDKAASAAARHHGTHDPHHAAVAQAHAGPKHGAADHAPAPKHDAHAGGDTHGHIEFKKVDNWQRLLPQTADPSDRGRLLHEVKEKVTADRVASAKLLDKLRHDQLKASAQIRGLKPGLIGQLDAAAHSATGKVWAAEAAQSAAVQAHIAGAKAQVQGSAKASIAQVNASFTQTVAQLDTALAQAKAKLTQDHQQAVTKLAAEEQAEVAAVATIFSNAEQKITAYGATKGSQAAALGDMPLPYSGDELDAARKAAHQVAEKYATAMPQEGQKAAATISGQLGGVNDSIHQAAAQFKDKLQTVFDNATKAVDAAHTSAMQAAQQVKQSALQNVNHTESSSIAGLSTLGTSTVAGIKSQAGGASSSITKATAAARAGISQAVDKAATGVARGAAGVIKAAHEMELPDPHLIGANVKKAEGELRHAEQSLSGGLHGRTSSASGALGNQANGAAQTIGAIAGHANGQASQMSGGASQALHQVAHGAGESDQKISKQFTKQCTEATTSAAQAYTALDDQAKQTFDKQNTTLTQKLDSAVQGVEAKFDQVVPDQEKADISANAKKAADSVPKHWWDSVISFVVKVVVAVAVGVAVGALIAATGGLAAPLALVAVVAIGAAGGAAGYALGQMASNLVEGKGLFDDLNWKDLAISALAGGLTAGTMSAIGGVGEASGSLLADGIASRIGVTAFDEGATGAGAFAVKVGTDIAVDTASDAVAQEVVTGKYEFDINKLLVTAVSAGITTSLEPVSDAAGDRIQTHLPDALGGGEHGAGAGGERGGGSEKGGASKAAAEPAAEPASAAAPAPEAPAPAPAPAPEAPAAPDATAAKDQAPDSSI